MSDIATLFITKLYRAEIENARALNADLAKSCRAIASEDEAGKAWSREKG